MKRHIFTVGVTALLAVTTLSACGNDSDALVVGASPTPHGDILEYISDNLAEDAGLTIEIQEFSDYVQPNPALTNGDIDANFFQHQPYLDEYNAAEGGDLVPVVEVLIEPLGAYSSTLDSIDQLPDNAQVSIPSDATNGGRALDLLADHGLITVDADLDTLATEADIVDNPKNLEIIPLEAAQLPRSLDDVDLAVINGNYALEADLTPKEDALILESGENNPFANVLVVREADLDSEPIKILAELLTSDEVRTYIEENFPNSIPTF
ncbi:MAG TPA: MetQ/NlpA family ABC transporter substrate-binding protein [Candidatus Stackebrandtia excrementipullorum]|nr:MetQ/NlpA family ABC transporter substrate-binding protein [Candidatus Stackebrandtia excrementipullorum]